MISRPIRVDRAINFFADKIGPSVFCVSSEGAAEREGEGGESKRQGPVMSRFSPEAFQVSYRPGIRALEREEERQPDERASEREREREKGIRGKKTEGEERT